MTAGTTEAAPLKDARQERYAQLRAKGKTRDAAYAEAGYKPNRSNAARLEAKKHVQARIATIMGPCLAAAEIDADRTLAELAHVGFGDIRKLFDETGQVRPIHELDVGTAAMIASVEVAVDKKGVRIEKLRLWNKISALEAIAKVLKMIGEAALPTELDGAIRTSDVRTQQMLREIAERIGPRAVAAFERDQALAKGSGNSGDDGSMH